MPDIFNTLLGIGFPENIAFHLADTGKTLLQIKRLSNDQQRHFGITQELKERLSNRKPIPETTVSKLLKDSSRICCICKGAHSDAIVIHHIISWEDTMDNSEENLVVLCLHCHGEAHTNRELSRNLTKEQIRDFKKEWVELVKKTAEDRARGITTIQNLEYWDYFNHGRIFSLIGDLGINLNSAVQSDVGKQLYQGGFITTNGSLVFSQWPEDIESRGYWLSFFEGMWISQYMINVNNCLFQNINLKTIDSHQSPKEILSIIGTGDFVLIQDAFFFKKLVEGYSGRDQNKSIYIRKKGLEIKGLIDSWNCISMSAKTRLSGKRRATVVGIVTNINQNGTKLAIDLSIIAIGHFIHPSVFNIINRSNNL